MGLTVSVIVAEIVMQAIEEGTLAAYQQTLPIWLRYDDNTYWGVHQHHQDNKNTWQLQTSVFWCEIALYQYSTSIGFTVYWDHHQMLN